MIKENFEKEFKECTFQPNIHKISNPSAENMIESTFNKLYEDHEAKENRINALKEKYNKELEDKLNNNCTFTPFLIAEMKRKAFENKGTSILNDTLVKMSVKRYEKARIQKKVNDIHKSKGFTNLNSISDLEEQLNEKPLTLFNCSSEKRFFKHTLDIHKIIASSTKSLDVAAKTPKLRQRSLSPLFKKENENTIGSKDNVTLSTGGNNIDENNQS